MTEDMHTCPLCELRFAWITELRDHLDHDHAERLQPGRFTSYRPPTATSRGVVTVPLDPDRELATVTLDTAVMLARQAQLGVELVAVPHPETRTTTTAFLRAAAHRLEGRDLTGERWRLLPDGDVAATLLDHLANARPDLVCMSSRSSRAASELLFGSVSAEVLRRSPVPVVVVGPHVTAAPHRVSQVVVCLDGSEYGEHALEVADAVAARLGIELFLVQVLDPAVDTGDVQESAYLHRQVDHLDAKVAGYDVLHHRDPARGILTFLDDNSTAFVAMGTHGRTAARHLVTGSVTSDVVRHAACPVLVVPATAEAGHRRTVAAAGSREASRS
jgi:nucleotide-binding universal stress UspA family protein